MAKRQSKVQHVLINGNLTKLLGGLGLVGTLGIGGASYSQSTHADERTAKLEAKVEKLEEERKEDRRQLGKIDQRTIRMEEYLKLMGRKMGVKANREEE
jgi:hypothetical protein